MNSVHLIGRLGRDPETKHTSSGSAVCNFSVATEERYTSNGEKQAKTTWHRIVAWKQLAETCAKYLQKGSQVAIEGRLQNREWEKDGQKHTTTEIVADKVHFLGGQKQAKKQESQDRISDEDMPF